MAKKIEVLEKNMPIGIIITDTHISEENRDTNISIWNQACKYAIEYKVPIYHAGDVFKSRKGQSEPILNTIHDIKRNLIALNVQTYMIPGNHDKQNQSSPRSYLDVYNEPLFRIVDTWSYIKDGVYMLAYFKENETDYSEYLSQIVADIKKKRKEDPTFKAKLITHIAINGVMNNNGSHVENNLTKELFKEFEIVICGHYHNQSVIGSNIYYIGSSFSHNYGEDDRKNIILLYDNGDIERLETVFPKHTKIIVSVEEVTTTFLKELETHKENTKDNIRLIIQGDKVKIKSVKSLLVDSSLSIKTEESEITRQVEEAASKTVETSFDIKKIKFYFEEFCEKNQIADKKTGSDYLLLIE